LEEANFVAIDTELTGLSERADQNKSSDSPQARYTKVRNASKKFMIIQFGLCALLIREFVATSIYSQRMLTIKTRMTSCSASGFHFFQGFFSDAKQQF
jgi:hypothetical protein